MSDLRQETKVEVVSRIMGLRDIFITKVTSNTASSYTTGIPRKLARSLSAKVTFKYEVTTLYSDDVVENIIRELKSVEVEVEVNDLSPIDLEDIDGCTVKNGYILDTANNDPAEIAMSWRAKRTDRKYEFTQLYCGKNSDGSTDSYETAGDKLKTQTPKRKFLFYPRAKDEYVRTRVNESYLVEANKDALAAIKDWFSKVQEPVLTDAQA